MLRWASSKERKEKKKKKNKVEERKEEKTSFCDSKVEMISGGEKADDD